MNIQELKQLQAELGGLRSLLASTPEQNVIERIGLESREKSLLELLAAQPSMNREPARARLTFRGKPVVGTHGMHAEFGTDALRAFTDVVAAVGASRGRTLASRGALPDRDKHQFLITGAAVGSFGFQLEEAAIESVGGSATLFDEDSTVGSALQQTTQLMKATQGSDDDLADVVAELDPRALECMRKFFRTLADNEAVCALAIKDDRFLFSDVAQVKASLNRLRVDNIHEETEQLEGQFRGVLPTKRTFEFETSSGKVITGNVGPEVDDAGSINALVNKPRTITVIKKTVGAGSPRYRLSSF
jgi:hypothetical protein